MKTTVIYHKADYDGIFCREIAKKFLGEKDVEYIGWDYNEEEPAIPPDHKIYMLDISVPSLINDPNLIWIDHHKSAIEKYGKKVGYQIDGVAACRLAWQWFSLMKDTPDPEKYGLPSKEDYLKRNVTEPFAVTLAGEYDIWDHKPSDGDDIVFQFGLDSQEQIEWEFLLVNGRDGNQYAAYILTEGHYAKQCYKTRDASVIKDRSFLVELYGLKFLALNTPRCNSNTFESKDTVETGHDALMAFYFNGKKWTYSMYHAKHNKEIDLSEIAVKYGGGGHRGACGFSSDGLII